MRTLLVTGPGGAGRTVVTAATAVAAARGGHRTLLLTSDREETAGTLLGAPLGPAATRIGGVPGLSAARIDTAGSFRTRVTGLQSRLGPVLDLLGATALDPEELTELPGADTLALLSTLRDVHHLGTRPADAPYDLVVVDLPPVRAAVAALGLPEQLRRYLRRLLPAERQAARALRPVLAQLAGVPMPARWAYEAAERADRELAETQAVIDDVSTSIRVVLEPGPGGAEALRVAGAGLALLGHGIDGVVANRILPAGSADPFLAGLAGEQREHLRTLSKERGGTGVCELPHLGRAPWGPGDLAALADRASSTVPAAEGGLLMDLFRGPEGPAGPAEAPWRVENRLADDGYFLWRLPLPGATRDTLDLVRRGDEMVVDAEGFRRTFPLPPALRRCTVEGAALREGFLQVRFAPDPGLWPR